MDSPVIRIKLNITSEISTINPNETRDSDKLDRQINVFVENRVLKRGAGHAELYDKEAKYFFVEIKNNLANFLFFKTKLEKLSDSNKYQQAKIKRLWQTSYALGSLES